MISNIQETIDRQLKGSNFYLSSTLKADEIIRSVKMKTLPFKERIEIMKTRENYSSVLRRKQL